jgi:hypothetical protein
LKRFIVLLAVMLLVLVAATTASAHGRKHHRYNPTQTYCVDGQNVQLNVWQAGDATPGTCVVGGYTPGQIDRGGACVNGVFENITAEEQGFAGGWYLPGPTTPAPADYVQGVGLTCNTTGYVSAGYSVTGDGTVDTAAPQFNIYPYYVTA